MPHGPVLIVDDDQAVRDSTARLLRRAGYTVESYESGDAFLQSTIADAVTCILLDIRMPGTDGIATLRQLSSRGNLPRVIMITGHGDIPLAVEAMRLGASDFLEKPYTPERLFQSIDKALERIAGKPESEPRPALDPEAQAGLERLSWRQRQVLAGIMCGHPNKIIAYELGLSIRTVEAYRAQLLVKLRLRGTAEVVKFALAAGIDASEFGKTLEGEDHAAEDDLLG